MGPCCLGIILAKRKTNLSLAKEKENGWNFCFWYFLSDLHPRGREQVLSLWRGSTDCNSLDYQIYNPREYPLVAQRFKRLPSMRETWVQSLGQEDPLEKEMATHSSTLAWRIPMDGVGWCATVHRVPKSQTRLSDFIFTFTLREYQIVRTHIKETT